MIKKKTESTPKKEVVSIEDNAKKKKMLISLEETLGIVTTAAKKANIHRASHYKWMDSDPDYAEKVREINDLTLDYVEGSLLKQIRDQNTIATIFYLKTKGKVRGYSERLEIHQTEIPATIEEINNKLEDIAQKEGITLEALCKRDGIEI